MCHLDHSLGSVQFSGIKYIHNDVQLNVQTFKTGFLIKFSIIPLQSIQVVQERHWDDNTQCLGVCRGRRREKGGLGKGQVRGEKKARSSSHHRNFYLRFGIFSSWNLAAESLWGYWEACEKILIPNEFKVFEFSWYYLINIAREYCSQLMEL